MRPLLIAETANPEWVSVPLEGWSLATAIQRRLPGAHIVTQIRNREAFLRAGMVEGEDFTAIDSEAVAGLAHKAASALRMGQGKGWTTVMALSSLAYPYFERLVWRRFGDDIAAGRFDLVHRITPLSPTVVSPIAAKVKAAGRPFVIGPINGGVPWPPGFDAERRREREWLSYVRGFYKLRPGRRASLGATAAIIAGSRHTESEVPARLRDRTIYIPENAVDTTRFTLEPREALSTPLRGCFIGRLVPYKGADMLLEAAAPLLRDGRLTLDIVGDGPMMADLQALAAREGVAQAVTFHGWVAHAEVQNVVQECDLFTFPSVREFGGAVVLEAMCLGVAPVVVDYGGPGEHVIDGVGFKVPIGRREALVADFRATLTRVTADREGLPAVRRAARARVIKKYTWDAKAAQVMQVYEWVLGRRPDRPDPFAT
jgi:glycosyltransferase involved in cell wall biosynthesis